MATPYNDKLTALAALSAELRDRTGLGADKTSRSGVNDILDKLVENIGLASLGVINGLTLSNNVTDANNDVDIAAGICVSQSGTFDWLRNTATLTKQLDAAWASGNNAGGLFTGTKANSTWYYLHLIQKTSDGTIDAGFDTSVTAANIPAGYAAYRRLGSVRTDGSANLLPFSQSADEFWLSVPVLDYNTTNPGTSAVTPTLTVAPSSLAVVDVTVKDTTPTVSATHCLVTGPDQADTVPSSSLYSMSIPAGVGFTERIESSRMVVRSNSSSQIRLRLDNSDADVTLSVLTHGWIDRRGRD